MKQLIYGAAWVFGVVWTLGFLAYLTIRGENGAEVRFWMPFIGYTDCNR